MKNENFKVAAYRFIALSLSLFQLLRMLLYFLGDDEMISHALAAALSIITVLGFDYYCIQKQYWRSRRKK